jgi:uncharacterized membrane protein
LNPDRGRFLWALRVGIAPVFLDQPADAVTALAWAASALDAQQVKLALDVGKYEIGSVFSGLLGRTEIAFYHCPKLGWRSRMQMSQLNYLPLATELFWLLVGLLFMVGLVFVLLQFLGMLRQAYKSLGVAPHTALLLLAGSLIGSYFDIPLAKLPTEHVTSDRVIELFGVQFAAPNAVWPGTVLAINVGGGVIPTLMSIYLLMMRGLWIEGVGAATAVALLMHWLATPVPGSGITVPVFLPALTAYLIALLLSRQKAAPLAYIGGSLGTLTGADLTNLDKVSGLDASIVSIGGAGTFDAIFMTSILATFATIGYQQRTARLH